MDEKIRVFPRKTAMTPTDAYAFIGDPPLWRPPAEEVHVSVTFTWDIEEGYRLAEAWAKYYPIVRIGGPAIDGSGRNGAFVPGMYIKHGVTFTTRGCPNHCPWCLAWRWEGKLRCLAIMPGWIVQDNNLLAAPRDHQEAVFDMLRAQKRAVSFPGGLDARLVDRWIADQLQRLRIKEVFLAADTKAALERLREAVEKLDFLKRHQLRCYVLIGFGGETILEAAERLETVWQIGCLPFAQLYQPPDHFIHYPKPWRDLARTWMRPAAMAALHRR